ncbi:hypothetical protein FOZ60_007480 [Perkinsus olseni]|uniref:Kinesin-like protein n=1 Tax=Perkinsus olseni TaxID=32597 RepID=A0A7J6PMM8_PEROL|nr:hypothetical protein FOZ60_007480 [Perkinsus olseni]
MGLNGAGVSVHFAAEKFCCLESRGERVRSILCVQRLAMPGTPSTTHSSHRLSDECVKVVVRSRPELPSDNRSHCVEKPNQSLTAQFGLPSPDEPGAGASPWYGVTGSGKTYTMMGNTENKGLIPQSFGELFYKLKTRPGSSISVSFLEIYGKKLVDLFNTEARAASVAGSAATLEICGNSTRIHVRGIKEILVKNEFSKMGARCCTSGQTECNESSSRSHAVFTINFTSSAGRRSKLVMIDLAGSENVKRSKVNKDGVKEAGEINTSLSVLGRVVEALNNGSSHVPYRESLLTRLLQDSLGGNCKTCMIATINPERRNENEYRQTMNTLQFALRMSKVVNRPRIATIDSTEKRGSLSSTAFNQQELEETMTRTMEELKTEFKGWRENLENLVGRNNRASLAELEEVKRVHRENMGAKEQHIEDVKASYCLKVQLEAARTELQRLHAGMLERSQEAERHMEEINEKHRMEMRKLHDELVSVTAAAASNREAAARLEAELIEARSQASGSPELLSELEAQRAEVRRLSAELESMTGERDDALNEEKALSSKTEEERSVLEEMVDPPNSDALECMRNHYERIVLELRQREAHLCEELSRARELWTQSQSELCRQGSTDLLSRLPRALPSPTRPIGLEQASGGPLDPKLMGSVDRLEAHISRCGGDHSLPGAEKAIARELKHIYDGASASPEELYPAVYHLLVRVSNPGRSETLSTCIAGGEGGAVYRFMGLLIVSGVHSPRIADEDLLDVDGAVVQEVAELVLQVMCANAGHADTYKHCVLLLETLLASVQHSDSCKSVLRDHPHLQRALVAARDALRNRVTTPEMILGKASVSEDVGENTKMALQRVEADDDNTVYRGLVRLGRFFGVELE